MAFPKKKSVEEVEPEEAGSEPAPAAKKKKSKLDGKDLLELVGKVQQKRDSKRKSKVALPPQLSKEPKEPSE